MTATEAGVLYPRTLEMPPTTAPARPSGLEQVTKVFAAMADPVRRVVAPVMRYAAPPLALANAAGEGMRTYQQATSDTPDYAQMALSGLGALGSVMSAFPPTAPVGIPLATVAPVGRDILEKLRAQQARAAAEGIAPLSPEEQAQASRAAFGRYPRAASRMSPLNSPGASGY
mgnify:FL=1